MRDALVSYSPAAVRTPTEMTVLLVEEHALMRAALRLLLAATPGLSVVAEAHTLALAPALALLHRPDVMLVDGRATGGYEDSGLRLLRESAPDACLLVLTDDSSSNTVGMGHAHGCLAKDADTDALRSMLLSLLGARCSNCALRAACPVPQLATALSRRERQVAIRIAEGLTSKQIAGALGISLTTVHTYRESLARKLGASSAAVITRFVLSAGLTESPLPSASVRL